MDGRAFEGIGSLIAAFFVVSLISVPLAIWKAVDICIYVAERVQWQEPAK